MECKNTRYIMRRNLQLLNVKLVWIYVIHHERWVLGFLDVCGVRIFTEASHVSQ